MEAARGNEETRATTTVHIDALNDMRRIATPRAAWPTRFSTPRTERTDADRL
jgi:hypothetical protein